MAHQQSRLNRLWPRSSLSVQQQCTSSGTPLAGIHSGSLQQVVDTSRECHKLANTEAQESFHDSNLHIDPWMEALSSFLDCQFESDSSITPNSFRNALEKLSLSSLCGVDVEPASWSDTDALLPQRDREEAATGLIGIAGLAGIPNEISFAQPNSPYTRQGKLPEMLADLEIPDKRKSFSKVLRKLAFVGNGSRTTNSVAKMYLYIEQPKPLEHTNSITNSTITWSSEHRSHAL
jgi:hypothetical protein